MLLRVFCVLCVVYAVQAGKAPAGKAKNAKVQTGEAETVKTETVNVQTGEAETVKTETVKVQTGKAQTGRGQAGRSHTRAQYSVNPCDAERKEEGAYAWCWHCNDASTEEECQQTGEYTRCPNVNDICYKYSQTKGNNDGTRMDTLKFDRGCKPVASCSNAALGPDNWACSMDRNDPSRTNCLQCHYGDYHCGPQNPCTDDKGKAANLWCLSCKNAASDEECEATGTYMQCPSSKHLCYRFEQRSGTTGRTKIDRGCLPDSACDNAALGPQDQACHPSKNDPATTVCRTCGTDSAICKPPSTFATCSCRGDPHCHQFDQTLDSPPLNIKGSCIYTLAKDGCTSGDFTFEVLANFHKSEIGRPLTYVDQVIIIVRTGKGSKQRIVLGHGGEVKVNSERISLPYKAKHFDISMDKEGNTVVALPNGMEVVWNNVKMVEVKAPSDFMGDLCGICGRYTGKEGTVDRLMGPFKLQDTCPALGQGTPGEQADDDQTFANSWLAALDKGDAHCTHDCTHGIL